MARGFPGQKGKMFHWLPLLFLRLGDQQKQRNGTNAQAEEDCPGLHQQGVSAGLRERVYGCVDYLQLNDQVVFNG